MLRRPYLLPCVAASFLGLCATLMSCFAVRETLPALRRDRLPAQGGLLLVLCCTPNPNQNLLSVACRTAQASKRRLAAGSR